MDELIMNNLHIASKQILEDRQDLSLSECSPGEDSILQITTITKLSYDVTIIDCGVDIDASDNIHV